MQKWKEWFYAQETYAADPLKLVFFSPLINIHKCIVYCMSQSQHFLHLLCRGKALQPLMQKCVQKIAPGQICDSRKIAALVWQQCVCVLFYFSIFLYIGKPFSHFSGSHTGAIQPMGQFWFGTIYNLRFTTKRCLFPIHKQKSLNTITKKNFNGQWAGEVFYLCLCVYLNDLEYKQRPSRAMKRWKYFVWKKNLVRTKEIIGVFKIVRKRHPLECSSYRKCQEHSGPYEGSDQMILGLIWTWIFLKVSPFPVLNGIANLFRSESAADPFFIRIKQVLQSSVPNLIVAHPLFRNQ